MVNKSWDAHDGKKFEDPDISSTQTEMYGKATGKHLWLKYSRRKDSTKNRFHPRQDLRNQIASPQEPAFDILNEAALNCKYY